MKELVKLDKAGTLAVTRREKVAAQAIEDAHLEAEVRIARKTADLHVIQSVTNTGLLAAARSAWWRRS